MLKLGLEDFETDWESFLSSLVLEKIAWEKAYRRRSCRQNDC